MKISLRVKVVLMTLVLALTLIGSSVLISSLIFSARSEADELDDCRSAAANMTERIEEYSTYYEFIGEYAAEIQSIYAENYDDLVYHSQNEFDSPEQEAAYYGGLTRHLFPASNGGLGMSLGQLNFKMHYYDVFNELLLVSNVFDTEGGYIFWYDREHDYVVYLMDATDESSPLYAYPASIEHPSQQWKDAALARAEVAAYVKKNDYGKYCYSSCPVVDKETGETIAYVGFNYDMGKLQKTQRDYITTITLIMLVAMVVIAVVYLLLAEMFLVKNIRTLSHSTAEFTQMLAGGKALRPVVSHVKSHDEIGALSRQFDVMQEKLVQYVDALEQKKEEEHRRGAELAIAANIQNEELPAGAYEDGAVKVSADITSAKEVGGDFYDYFYIDAGRLAVVIADVSGKGVPAALFMMKAKSLIKTKLQATGDLLATMYEVNNTLLDNNKQGLFVTAFVGVIDLAARRMECVSAGHEKPYLVGDGKVCRLSVNSNFVLAGLKNFAYTKDVVDLRGMRLFLFTDGLNESINAAGEEFGYARIEQSLSQCLADTQEQTFARVKGDLRDFVGEAEPFDDVTLLAVELKEGGRFEVTYTNPDYDVIEDATDRCNAAFAHIGKERLSLIDVVIDEVINNVVSYEKHDGLLLKVEGKLEEDCAVLTFSSNGPPFDPIGVQDKYLDSIDADTAAGGFGMTITRRISDDIDYRRADGFNVLVVKKSLKDN